MSQNGKRYRTSAEILDRNKLYSPGEALELIKSMAGAKFDETIELSMALGLDVRKEDQKVRGTVSLPKGTGKKIKVIVFAQADKAREAQEAGADEVGAQELADKIQKGWTDFDVAISTPELMGPVVSKLGKVLGPRGLMPSPKGGTVTMDIGRTVKEIKAGKIEYKTDRQANVHAIIGKASFPLEDLAENYLAVIEEVIKAKPAAAKGRYLKSVTLAPTMGPGVRIDPNRPKELQPAGS